MDKNFSQSQTVKDLPRSLRGLPFGKMKDAVLGPSYKLSLVFIGDALSRKLNRTYRGKDRPTNVLSFPVSSKSGEIFINIKKVSQERKEFEKSLKDLTGYLFIHGMLHLKGMGHGSRMEEAENKILIKFKLQNNDSRDPSGY
ncbi:MAG: rRNA maturation RNase YbeY [Parcubacteria group bacterium]